MLTRDDVDAVLELGADPLVRHYSGRLIDTEDDALSLAGRADERWQTRTGVDWAVCSGNLLVGTIGFGETRPQHAMVGYMLSPAGRGRGVATAAVRAGTATVFDLLDIHRIVLSHSVDNVGSCRVATKSGYALEGTARHGMRYPADGRWSDEHVHARLSTDPPIG